MVGDKIVKKIPLFNKKGELKGSIDELKSDTPLFKMFAFDINDDEGQKLAADKMAEMFDKQAEWMESLTYPEKLEAYGHTFESLAEVYRGSVNYNIELLRRLRFINRWRDERKGPAICECSAMVWDSDEEGFVVPYLYCVIKEGQKRLEVEKKEVGSLCATCSNTPCDHFFDPTHSTSDCIGADYKRRESEKYPSTPCVYTNPSDEDIGIALGYHEEEFGSLEEDDEEL